MALPGGALPGHHRGSHTVVDDRASVAFRGNRYSVRPGDGRRRAHAAPPARHRAASRSSRRRASCSSPTALAQPGPGRWCAPPSHRAALEAVVLGQFTTARPCDRKANKPPGEAALAERARLLGTGGDAEPSVDLEAMAEIIALAFPGTDRGRGGVGMSENSEVPSSCGPIWPSCA